MKGTKWKEMMQEKHSKEQYGRKLHEKKSFKGKDIDYNGRRTKI